VTGRQLRAPSLSLCYYLIEEILGGAVLHAKFQPPGFSLIPIPRNRQFETSAQSHFVILSVVKDLVFSRGDGILR
jgi:hypothetical protein